uniref:DNA-directed RNA polymerase subunit n=1 Tax=Halimeda discoidea TaxID=118222 RepID=A0A1C9JB20_9CHLO|nr:RNA polymerase b1-subunit [Halimeda discoidea]
MTVTGLRLCIATSQLIRQWAQRQLPNGKKIHGQILNPKTINYHTLKPERDGLFCERIFGPINESLCACGRPPVRGQKFCPDCEVEYISTRVRRYRLGYIQLITASAHTWFRNFFSLFLNLPKSKIEGLIYCTQNISRTIFPKELMFYSFEREKKLEADKYSLRFATVQRDQKYPQRFRRRRKVRSQNKLVLYKNSSQKRKEYKKSLWQNGGIRDAALYFGISLISKMSSWERQEQWFCFVFFVVHSPTQGEILNKWYAGPPGLVNFWGFQSRLFCFTGIQLMRTWLTQLTKYQCHDGRLLEIQIRVDLLQLEHHEPLSENEFLNKIQLCRRFKYLRSFRYTQMNPASMVLSVLPVLPPDLRPIIELENHQLAISDLNKLYQTILFRNRRLSRLTRDLDVNFHCLNCEAIQYGQRLLQESLDDLIENGSDSNSKSLSDLFKGKKGRFRQNLLGKRVDYSGRSVIVVGPQLKIYECGLPKEIAYELFQPFVLRILILQNKAKTILGAKKLYKKKAPYFIKQIVQSHPILLNRAPTLHRLSIQAFQPRLINGKAILLHPLVCSAFNADFDGDQMGIHIPLCFEARAEAWKIAWSQNNLFSVATSSPVCLPSQDMILGSCFLTMGQFQHTPIWGTYNKNFYGFETEKKTQKLIEIRVFARGASQKFRFQFYQHYHSSGAELLRKIRTTSGRIQFYQNI